MLLANNVLLSVAMAAVLLGTLYPLFLDALDMGKISVGPPYFDSVFYPLMAPAVFLMAIGPVASWKRAALPGLWTRLRWALAVSIVAALVIPFALGKFTPLVAFGLWLALWVISATVAHVWQRLGSSPQATLGARVAAQPLAWYGMAVAHMGVAVFIIGVTLVKGYERELDLRMSPGDRVTLGGHEFTFKGAKEVPGPNYAAMQGDFEVRAVGGGAPRVMHPEKRTYFATGMTMTEADIDTGLFRDLYVSLGEPVESGAWGVRVYYKPFVDWIWGGCFLMAIGGILAMSDRRYRPRKVASAEGIAAQAARA
jgi:cytochrome c-type biogenesis protein CcmF